MTVVSAAVTAAIFLAVVFASWVAPHDPFDLVSIDLPDTSLPQRVVIALAVAVGSCLARQAIFQMSLVIPCIVRGLLLLLTLVPLCLSQASAADPPDRPGSRAEFELIGAVAAAVACSERTGPGSMKWVPACIDPIWEAIDVSGDGALSPAEIVRFLRVLGAILGENDAEDGVTGPDLIAIGALAGPVLSGILMANLDYDASGLIERSELDSFVVSEATGLDWKEWINGLPSRLRGIDDLVPEGLDPRKRSSP